MGRSTCRAHVARDGRPSCSRCWRPCKTRFIRTPAPRSWRPRCLRRGKRGRLSRPRPVSGPRRRSKGATAPCRRCITIIGVCPNAAPRSGRRCITSMVALQMGRHQPRGFSGRDFLTSLKRCYRMSRICPDLGTASRSWRSVVEVIRDLQKNKIPYIVEPLTGTSSQVLSTAERFL